MRVDPTVMPIAPGGAVNLRGHSASTFDASKIDHTWAPPGGFAVMDPVDLFVARVTLSADAMGTVDLLGSAFQVDDFTLPSTADVGPTATLSMAIFSRPSASRTQSQSDLAAAHPHPSRLRYPVPSQSQYSHRLSLRSRQSNRTPSRRS